LKESDIRSSAGNIAEIKKEKKWIKENWLTVQGFLKEEIVSERNCPCCASAKKTQFAYYREFSYQECVECRTIYVSPSPTDVALSTFYSSPECRGDYEKNVLNSGVPGIRLKKILSPRKDYILSCADSSKHHRVLDVGCSSGQFLSLFPKNGKFELHGIDADSSAINSARLNYSDISFKEGMVEVCDF
jgi:hypothetical protein